MSLPSPDTPDPFGFAPAFAVDEPAAHTIPYVFNTGHSGAVYPPETIAASYESGTRLTRCGDTPSPFICPKTCGSSS